MLLRIECGPVGEHRAGCGMGYFLCGFRKQYSGSMGRSITSEHLFWCLKVHWRIHWVVMVRTDLYRIWRHGGVEFPMIPNLNVL